MLAQCGLTSGARSAPRIWNFEPWVTEVERVKLITTPPSWPPCYSFWMIGLWDFLVSLHINLLCSVWPLPSMTSYVWHMHRYPCFARTPDFVHLEGRHPLISGKVGLSPASRGPLCRSLLPSIIIAIATKWHRNVSLWNARESWQRGCWKYLYPLIKEQKCHEDTFPFSFSLPQLLSSHPQFPAFEDNCNFWSLNPPWDHKATGVRMEGQHAKFVTQFCCLKNNHEISVDYGKHLFSCSQVCKFSLALLGSAEIGWVWLQAVSWVQVCFMCFLTLLCQWLHKVVLMVDHRSARDWVEMRYLLRPRLRTRTRSYFHPHSIG